jgi:cephalosporin-C deacetylase-like acetyl esterase
MPTGVQFTICLPQEATYTRWKSAKENNLLDCARWYLRGLDFLAGRPEVKAGRIVVRGASRSGPLAVIAAARRPKNICGVSAFVHTSAGISWTDKPYVAWGLPGGHNASNADQVSRLAAMAAYVDPVNHAPDVTCPIWFGYGIDDTLAPPQGIEAMYRLCASKWKRISRDAGGHQYSPGMQKLEKELQELLSAGG